MRTQPFQLPAPLLAWLHELGWSERVRFQSNLIDRMGTPVLVWLIDRMLDAEKEPLYPRNKNCGIRILLPLFEELIAVLPHPHAAGQDGRTPLHAAEGCLPLLHRLIDAGAPLETRDSYGNTPLMNALREAQVDAVDLLLLSGANPHAVSENTGTMHEAVRSSPVLVQRLLDRSVDPNLPSKSKNTPLGIVLFDQENAAAVEYLIEAGGRITTEVLARAINTKCSPSRFQRFLDACPPWEASVSLDLVSRAAHHNPALLPLLLKTDDDFTDNANVERNGVPENPLIVLIDNWAKHNDHDYSLFSAVDREDIAYYAGLLLERGVPLAPVLAFLLGKTQEDLPSNHRRRLEEALAVVRAWHLDGAVVQTERSAAAKTRLRF